MKAIITNPMFRLLFWSCIDSPTKG